MSGLRLQNVQARSGIGPRQAASGPFSLGWHDLVRLGLLNPEIGKFLIRLLISRYLKRVLLDEELLGMKNFVANDPFGSMETTEAKHLVLDGQTLSNLEVRVSPLLRSPLCLC